MLIGFTINSLINSHYESCRYQKRRIQEEQEILKRLVHERRNSQEETRLARLMADNAIAMAEEIALERRPVAVEKATAAEDEKDDKSETTAVVKNTHVQPHVPAFLKSITRTCRYRSKLGRDYVRCPRYPNEIVIMCIDMMVRNNVCVCQSLRIT